MQISAKFKTLSLQYLSKLDRLALNEGLEIVS
jgi:hypothetical protein